MLLKNDNAPYIRAKESNRTVMGDAIIALLPLYLMAVYYYGPRAAMLGLTSVLTCTVTEQLCVLLRGQKPNFRDFSPLVTGLILPLLLPASVPYALVIVGGIFAIAVIKQPFGGTGQNLFNPAAAAFALMAVSWPEQVFQYPMPLTHLDVFGELSTRLMAGPAHALRLGGLPVLNTLDMITGNFVGPMGATNILVLTTCLIYLIFRKAVSWQVPVTFLAASALMAALFPRVSVDATASVVMEMLSGTLMFGGIFLLGDPVTGPKRGMAKYMYGALAGICTMLFRRYGGYEQMVMFAILLMNAFAPVLDRLSEHILRILRRVKLEPNKRRDPQNSRRTQKEPV